MKKLTSLILAVLLCMSCFTLIGSAVDEAKAKTVTNVELHTVKYYEAVHNEAEIASAALYVNFLVYYTDGTTALYDSKKGWDNAEITSEVTWYIACENDENFGAQQSLYVTIDGVDYWAGYVDVEVNSFKATLRNIITWDWMTCEEKIEATHWLFKLLKMLFSILSKEVGGEAFDILYDAFNTADKIVYEVFPLEEDTTTEAPDESIDEGNEEVIAA